MRVVDRFLDWLLARQYADEPYQETVEVGQGPYHRGPVAVDKVRRVPLDGLTNGRREKIARNFGVLTLVLLTALGWIWHLAIGTVPSASSLSVPVAGDVSLPFSLSSILYAPLIASWTYILLSKTGLRFAWKYLWLLIPIGVLTGLLVSWPTVSALVFGVLCVSALVTLMNVGLCRGCESCGSCPMPSIGRVCRYGLIGAMVLTPVLGLLVMLPIGMIWAGIRLYRHEWTDE